MFAAKQKYAMPLPKAYEEGVEFTWDDRLHNFKAWMHYYMDDWGVPLAVFCGTTALMAITSGINNQRKKSSWTLLAGTVIQRNRFAAALAKVEELQGIHNESLRKLEQASDKVLKLAREDRCQPRLDQPSKRLSYTMSTGTPIRVGNGLIEWRDALQIVKQTLEGIRTHPANPQAGLTEVERDLIDKFMGPTTISLRDVQDLLAKGSTNFTDEDIKTAIKLIAGFEKGAKDRQHAIDGAQDKLPMLKRQEAHWKDALAGAKTELDKHERAAAQEDARRINAESLMDEAGFVKEMDGTSNQWPLAQATEVLGNIGRNLPVELPYLAFSAFAGMLYTMDPITRSSSTGDSTTMLVTRGSEANSTAVGSEESFLFKTRGVPGSEQYNYVTWKFLSGWFVAWTAGRILVVPIVNNIVQLVVSGTAHLSKTTALQDTEAPSGIGAWFMFRLKVIWENFNVVKGPAGAGVAIVCSYYWYLSTWGHSLSNDERMNSWLNTMRSCLDAENNDNAKALAHVVEDSATSVCRTLDETQIKDWMNELKTLYFMRQQAWSYSRNPKDILEAMNTRVDRLNGALSAGDSTKNAYFNEKIAGNHPGVAIAVGVALFVVGCWRSINLKAQRKKESLQMTEATSEAHAKFLDLQQRAARGKGSMFSDDEDDDETK